jgi:hypothetical protein
MITNIDTVPDGYTLEDFPATDFIVVTHEWLPTNEEALFLFYAYHPDLHRRDYA